MTISGKKLFVPARAEKLTRWEGTTSSYSALIQREQESSSADFNNAETPNVQPQLSRPQPSFPDFTIFPPSQIKSHQELITVESIEGKMDARMDNWNRQKKEHRQLVPAVVSPSESNGKYTSGKPQNTSGPSFGAAKQNSSVISQDSGKESLKPTHSE